MTSVALIGVCPVGGTTGLSHVHTPGVESAGDWLRRVAFGLCTRSEALVIVQGLFGLAIDDAFEAIRNAERERS